MELPEGAAQCMERLERSGFACYAVGGCVRDALLGLKPHDYDFCTSATPAQMEQVFSSCRLVLAGEKHGTVGVVTPDGVVEITAFRSEGGYTDGRHPGWVEFVTDITQDLARRDFTVNAMAWSPSRGLVDPFGGQNDLTRHILRAVGDPVRRFQEDALRILRGVRFAVRFHLTVEAETAGAMEKCAYLMDRLARERVFDELCKLLPLVTAEDLLHYQKIITQVIPELKPAVGLDQQNPHHKYDVYTHIAHVTAATPPDLALRWAALLHDVGKPVTFTVDEQGTGHFYGHAQEGARIADAILLRLKAPTALRERVTFLIEKHMVDLRPDRKLLRRRLSQYGEEALRQLLALQKADFFSKGVISDRPYFEESEELLEKILAENSCLSLKDLAVKGNDLTALGFVGREIGLALQGLLNGVLAETLPNERQTLLEAAKKYQKNQEAEH